MNYTLSDIQQDAIEKVAKAEMRSVSQVVSLLLAEGISWTYIDSEPKYGDINTSDLENQLINEVKDSL